MNTNKSKWKSQIFYRVKLVWTVKLISVLVYLDFQHTFSRQYLICRTKFKRIPILTTNVVDASCFNSCINLGFELIGRLPLHPSVNLLVMSQNIWYYQILGTAVIFEMREELPIVVGCRICSADLCWNSLYLIPCVGRLL